MGLQLAGEVGLKEVLVVIIFFLLLLNEFITFVVVQ